MSNKPFYFKQFVVHQDITSSKVGTDGVLLGAWAKPPSFVRYALDIGTGTGVIALMLAQRLPHCDITAIDINQDAGNQAKYNAKNNAISNKVKVYTKSLQEFTAESRYKYDLIVSNPPFFASGEHAIDKHRSIARHEVTMSLTVLFVSVKKLLSDCGSFSLIIPKDRLKEAQIIAEKQKLYCTRECMVYPNKKKPSKRVLLEFCKQQKVCEQTILTIETNERHKYTEEYKRLLKDFYLKF